MSYVGVSDHTLPLTSQPFKLLTGLIYQPQTRTQRVSYLTLVSQYLSEDTLVSISGRSGESVVSISFAVTSSSNRFSFKEKTNFEGQVTEFIEVIEDLVYRKCPE